MFRSNAVALLICAISCSLVLGQAETPDSTADWVGGCGDSLEVYLRGVVVDESGNTIQGATVQGELLSALGTKPLRVETTDNGRFRIVVPAQESWWSINISGESPDSLLLGHKTVEGHELRRFARDGLDLNLVGREGGSDVRNVKITVVDGETPVPGAAVKATVESGKELNVIADQQGIADLPLLSSDKLRQITAWLDDQRIGGYQFSRQPPCDPTLNEYTVALNPSRPITVRLIDEQENPVPDVQFELNVSTGAPNYNFLGRTDHTTLTSDDNGEAIARWFPDWNDVNYYVDLRTDEWLITRQKTNQKQCD